MAMTYDPIAELEAEKKRAEAPKASRKPIFLFFKEGQKALVRPVYNLKEMIVFMKHDRYHVQKEFSVKALCGKQFDKTCMHCETVKDGGDKKLTGNKYFYVPVYVHAVVDKSGNRVTYTERDEQGNETEKPVKGFRLLELSMFGTVSAILKTFHEYYRDEASHDITACDFSITQVGSGQQKSFTILPKTPSAIDPQITAKKPTLEQFREAILAALPVQEAQGDAVAQGGQNAAPVSDDDDIPVF